MVQTLAGKQFSDVAVATAQQNLNRKLQGQRASFQNPFNPSVPLSEQERDEANKAFAVLSSIPENRRALSNIAAAKGRARELGFNRFSEAQQLSGFTETNFEKSTSKVEKIEPERKEGIKSQVFFSGGKRYNISALPDLRKKPVQGLPDLRSIANEQERRSSRMNQNIATIPRSPTIPEAYERTKLISKQEGIKEGIRTGLLSFSDAILKTTSRNSKREQTFNEEVLKKREYVDYRTRVVEDGQIPSGAKFPGGTAELEIDPVSDKELELNAKLGDRASYKILVDREKQELQRIADIKFSIAAEKVKAKSEELQEEVNKGTKTIDQANKEISEYSSAIQEDIVTGLNSNLALRKKRLERIAFQGNLSKVAVTSLAIAIPTGLAFGIISKGGRLVKTAELGGGVLFAKDVSKLSFDVAKGEKGLKEVALFGVGSAAFIWGFSAGARATSKLRPNQTQLKLENAIKNSEIIIKQKGLVTEKNIAKYDLPVQDLKNIKSQLKGERSFQLVEGEIKPTNIEDKKLINKELPYRKIEFIVITNKLGNVVKKIAIGKTKIKDQRGKTYKQEIIQESLGKMTDSQIEFKTITATGKKIKLTGESIKGIEKATMTKEISKGQKITIPDSPYRVIKSKTGVLLLDSIQGKKITPKDISKLQMSSELKEGVPVSASKFLQIQKKVKDSLEGYKTGKEGLVILSTDYLEVGAGKSINVNKILEVPKTTKSFGDKKITRDYLKDISKNQVKILEVPKTTKSFGDKKITSSNKKLDSEIKKSDTKIKTLEDPSNIQTGIKQSLEEAQKNIFKQKNKMITLQEGNLMPLYSSKSSLEQQSRQLTKSLTSQKSIQQSRQLQLNAQVLALRTIQQSRQLQLNAQVLALRTANKSRLKQNLSSQFNVPLQILPSIPQQTPKVVGGFGDIEKQTKTNLTKKKSEIKKIKKSPKYTPSLSSAISDYGIEIDPKKIDKKIKELSKQEYTGFEVRPLLKVKSKNKGR